MRCLKPVDYNTLKPYKIVEHHPIRYTNCRDFGHISRYRGLRQIIHNSGESDRFISLETPNAFNTNLKFRYYTVPKQYENRIDLIAKKFYGSSGYGWVVSYFNGIEDGYTVRAGQKIAILNSVTDLFSNGEILAPIPVMQLNLGSE